MPTPATYLAAALALSLAALAAADARAPLPLATNVAAGTSAGPGSNWTAVRLFEAAKPPQNARCLDGSPPLYYHSPGFGDGADKWEVHMEGGV